MTGDLVLPFQVDACGLRGRLARLADTRTRMLENHAYPAPLSRLMGEAAALAAVLAGSLKYDGLFKLQVQGDGPVSMLVVDVASNGDMRGYARFDSGRLATSDAARGGPLPGLLGAGHLAFTVDQGPDTERYQGIVPLEGATLADCAQTYFRRSEQLETAILLATDDRCAGALMIQRLPVPADADPETAEDDWRRGVILASSLRGEELLSATLPAPDLLYRLYHREGLRVGPPRPLRFQCRCSDARVRATLRSFPRHELDDMLEDGRITVTCQFCGAVYTYGPGEIDALQGHGDRENKS